MHLSKHISLTILIALCLNACSCQGQNTRAVKKEKKQIENVAYKYLDAMGNYRIRDAYKYANQETQDKTLRFIEEKIMPITDTNYIKKETPAKITITGITITSDTTADAYFHKSTPSSERNNVLNLVKRNGKWMANVPIDVPDVFNLPIDKKSQQRDSARYEKMILYEVPNDKAPAEPRK
ncbi:MAG: hypothetical protein IKR79_02160 [Bacteroidales bacterium]|nr:hypothetical protein [Bacteroidales bacterium]